MFKKRVLSLIIITALCLSTIFTGCGNNQTKDTSNINNEQKSEDESVETLDLSVYMLKFDKDPQETEVQKEWLKRMENYLGVKLNIDYQFSNVNEMTDKLNIKLASCDIPDICTCWGVETDKINEYGNDGILLDISQYDLPHYKKFIESTPNVEDIIYDQNNKMYMFFDAIYNPDKINAGGTEYSAAYRYDIFKKHDIKIPKTLDDMYNAAKKLKELYPNSYPIARLDTWIPVISPIFNANHIGGVFYYDGNEFVFGPNQPGYKEAVAYMKKLYDEKLLDPEYLSSTFEQSQANALNTKNFMFPLIWSGNISLFNENKVAKENGIQWVLAMNPQNPEFGDQWGGFTNSVNKSNYLRKNNSGILINANVKQPELIVKLIDYQYSDEMIELMNWGIEGTTYTKDSNGKKHFTDKVINAKDPTSILGDYGVSSSMVCRTGIVFSPQDFEAINLQSPSAPWCFDDKVIDDNLRLAIYNKYGSKFANPNCDAPPMVFTSDESEEISNIRTPVETFVDEEINKFIIGDRDFSEWEEFINEIKNYGDYDKVIKMYNEKIKK